MGSFSSVSCLLGGGKSAILAEEVGEARHIQMGNKVHIFSISDGVVN